MVLPNGSNCQPLIVRSQASSPLRLVAGQCAVNRNTDSIADCHGDQARYTLSNNCAASTSMHHCAHSRLQHIESLLCRSCAQCEERQLLYADHVELTQPRASLYSSRGALAK
eukprot:13206-Heterococcus_DN1.PRE.7